MSGLSDLPSFGHLARFSFWMRVWREMCRVDCWGMAAQLSFYFLLAFFPFLLFLSALIGFVPGWGDLVSHLVSGLNTLLPENAFLLIRRITDNLLASQNEGALTIGFVLSFWFASLAFNEMISLLNRAYEVQETRSLFRTRGLSLLVTAAVSFFVLTASILLFFGDSVVASLTDSVRVGRFYSLLRWGLALFFLNVGIGIVYFALPAKRMPWRLISPGSLVATLGFLVSSHGFAVYVNRFGNFQKFYGTLGSLIVLMCWFYIASLFLLIGGEIDSEIYKEHRARATSKS